MPLRPLRTIAALLLGLLLLLPDATGALSAPDGGASWTTRSTEQTLLHFDPNLPEIPDLAPDLFLSLFNEPIDAAVAELSLVFGIEPPARIDVWIVAAGDVTASAGVVSVDPGDRSLLIDGPGLTGLTEVEAVNAIRSAVAQRLLADAAGGQLAPLFVEGMALYARRPLTPVLSRYAALIQNANTQGGLLSWADLNRAAAGDTASSDLAVAGHYAVTAWLIDHFGIAAYQAFLRASSETADWRTALETAYGLPAHELERQWRDDLPRWTNNGWKTNVIAGFDLDPARALLERGNYAAAKASLERSQRLFSELGDEANLQTVAALITQCDVGLQAEALMAQTEAALRQHNYIRAGDLLTQAEAQYARLPPDQRPLAILQAYRERTDRGLVAIAQLENANRLVNSWTEFPQARRDALAAGAVFAEFGDANRLAAAEQTLHRIDERLRRLVLLLGGLAFLSLVWLLLWRKHGASQVMHWPERMRPVPPARRSG